MMKKTERINLIMRYINNRAQFTIKEIQNEFQISRATAIRDINEIQAMGFPLVSENGRGGGYFVMQNEYLPPVHFTKDELTAVFISFLASKNSQLPYLKNRKSISEKLIGIANQTQQDELIDLNSILLFENTNPANPNVLELDDAAPPELNQLISLAVQSRHLRVTYEWSPGFRELLDLWLFHIFNTNGQWLVEAYDFGQNKLRYLPVESLRESMISSQKMKVSEDELTELKRSSLRDGNLKISLDYMGIQRFKRLHPPGIILSFTGMFQSSGQFNAQIDIKNGEELSYFADWLLYLGDGVQFDKIPDQLRRLLLEKVSHLKNKL